MAANSPSSPIRRRRRRWPTARSARIVRSKQQFANRFTFYIGPDGRILDIDKGPRGTGVAARTAGEDTVKKLEALGGQEEVASSFQLEQLSGTGSW